MREGKDMKANLKILISKVMVLIDFRMEIE